MSGPCCRWTIVRNSAGATLNSTPEALIACIVAATAAPAAAAAPAAMSHLLLLLRFEHQQIRHGGTAVGVLEVGVLLAVDPDRVGLPRLQLHRQHTGPLVVEVLRLAGDLRVALLRKRRPRPRLILHVLAEGDLD